MVDIIIALIGFSCGLTAGLVMSLKKDIKRLSEKVDDLNERVCALETAQKKETVYVPYERPITSLYDTYKVTSISTKEQ